MRHIAYIVFGVGLLTGIGCGSVGGGFASPWRVGENGLFYHPKTGALYSGEYDHTIDGERHKGSIVNGQLEGQFTIWYASGVKKVEWTYVAGQRHGRVRSWFDGGLPRFLLRFNQGVLESGVTFRPDGVEASRMANGTGTLLAYYGNGQLNWEKTYKAGRRIAQKIYDSKGTLKAAQ